MSKSRLLAALALLLPLTAGCATTVAIRSMQPGAVSVGPTDHLVLLDGQGRRSAREFVAHELAQQCRARGYFSVQDRSEEGHEVQIRGRQASVADGEFTLDPHHAGVRIDVLEWNAQRDEEQVSHKNPDGTTRTETVPVLRGNVLLAVTLFDARGHAYLSEAEYEGWSTAAPDAQREETIETAARSAVVSLLNDITPIQVVTRVRLDDEDEGQKSILEAASSGAVAQAAADLERYLEQDPMNASAAYNLAVLREAMGDFSSALELYDRALSSGGKDYYARARAGCAYRMQSAEDLSGGNAR